MKTSLVGSLVIAAFISVGALGGFAQDPCADADIAALGDKFRAQYELKDVEGRKAAIATGKLYQEKYKTCGEKASLLEYLQTAIPRMEKAVAVDYDNQKIERFNTSVRAGNTAEAYASGKEILAKEPDNLDVIIVLARMGHGEAYKKNYKYSSEAITYAQQAISMLEAGKTTPTLGIFSNIQLKNKENALGILKSNIGYIQFYGNKDRKSALPYIQKALQHNSTAKDDPLLYEMIGSYFIGENDLLQDEIAALRKGLSETDPPDVRKKKEDEVDAKIALVNGLLERALDAYARASTVSGDAKNNKAYKDTVDATLQKIYKVRFGKLDGVDEWRVAAVAKPLPDPTTPVVPIFDPDPVAPSSATPPVETGKKPSTKPAKTVKAPAKAKKAPVKKKRG